MKHPSDSADPAPKARRVLLCVHGAAAAALTARLRDTGIDLPMLESDARGAGAALRAARKARPGHDVVLLRGDARLPDAWLPRLLAVDATHDIVSPLVLGEADADPANGADVHDHDALDAHCWLLGERRCVPARTWSPVLSLWRSRTLDALDFDAVDDGVPPPGLQAARLDALCVATSAPSIALRGAPAAIRTLAQRIAGTSFAAPARIGLDGKPVVLHVLHGWGGGAQRFVEDLARADGERHHLVLVARAAPGSTDVGERLALHACLDEPALREWTLSAPIAATAIAHAEYRDILACVCADWGVGGVIVSSLIGHSLDALRTGLPTAVACHDYYPVWPALGADFDDVSAAFDDAALPAALATPDLPFAERRPAFWSRLRREYVAALAAADARVIAPSQTVRRNLSRIEPAIAARGIARIEHGFAGWNNAPPRIAPSGDVGRLLRVAVVGRIHGGKGEHLLAQVFAQPPAGVEFVLVGAGRAGMRFFGIGGVHVVLDYARDALPELLARLRPDVALLPSTVAETYSYLLSELRSLRLPVIATRRGSFVERIRDGIDGLLVDADAASVMRLLSQLAADRAPLARLRDAEPPSLPTLADMAAAYRHALPIDARAVAGAEALALAEQRVAIAEDRLRALHDDLSSLRARIEAQHAELERRAAWGQAIERRFEERSRWAASLQADLDIAQREFARLQAEFDERTAWALSMQEDIARLHREYRAEIDALLNSTSWQVTRPLRAVRRRADALRARIGFQRQRIAALRHRATRSLTHRGVRGSLARLREEFARPEPAPAAQVPANEPFAPFALATSDAPVASVIVPAYNHFDATLLCLRALAGSGDGLPFEVIVVDDCSSDETAERLPQVDGLRYLRNESNLGFIGACNRGASQARGDVLVFLNNDTAVQPGWLDALVRTFSDVPDAGLVGSKLVYPDGRLQEAGGIVFSDGSGWNYGRFDDPADPRYTFVREADYCSGAAIAIRRGLFESLGGFDTYYAPAYYEDTDLAMKVRTRGLRVIYQPASVVVHFEGVTSGTDTGSGVKSYQVVNQRKFLERWRDALARHPAPGTDIAVAREHRARRRVLVIDATTPTPDQDSGSLRLTNLMRLLREEGCAVSFFADNRAFVDGYTQALQRLGVEVLWHPYLADPVRWLAENGRRFDVVFVSRHYVASKYLELVRTHAPRARFVFDTVDLHYLREQREAELSGSAEQQRRAAHTRAKELALIRRADVTCVVSPVERALLEREAPGAKVAVLSNVHEVHGRRVRFAERRDLVFVGGFQHPPNIDAAQWFVGEILPRVRARLPDVRFHLIGSKAGDAVKALGERPGVVFHGFVPDIAPYMDGCRLSVAPLRYGAGVKGKVNLAMAYGQPVVATSPAVEGMFVESGREVLVADTAQDFADAIVRAYGDETLWTRLSDEGLANVERHFSFDAARAAVRGLLAS